MRVRSESMSLVIDPASLVLITVNVPESALTMSLVITPVSLVTRTILPDLFTFTMSILALPLSSVLGSILEDELRPVLNLLVVVVTGQECFPQCAARLDRVYILCRSPHLSPLHDRSRGGQVWHVTSCLCATSPRLHLNDDPNLALQELL